ncbi:hypothetical protein GCM10022286_27050 [Gryllotalpicola daejeonensis]|uniref:DUF4192 family protein n=1 Tax=Gryllotalpicola daejeonensis TaxID=993087 RepID=A0ABP7ZMN4_9MICO
MTETAPLIRLRSSRDVVAAVPRLLGYRPSRSIVFLNTHDDGRVSTMRVDLPEPAPPKVEKRFITSLVGMLCKVPEVKRMLIVVFAGEPFDSGGDVPRASFIRPLIHRLLDSGFVVHDALCVAEDAWGAYDGHDAGIPHALDELAEAPLGAEGCEVAAEAPEQLAELPVVGYLARQAFDAAIDRAIRDTEVLRPIIAAEEFVALDPSSADSDELAAIMPVLLYPELRDAVLFTWAWGPDRGLELLDEAGRIEDGEIGPGDDTIALDLMGIGSAEPPDRGRIARAIALMAKVSALSPDDVAHMPLTVLAWLHWSQGRGSVAGHFVDRARELDPSYGLAELLQSVLRQGHLPGWAYVMPELSE